jgi:hypothetical protein
MAAMRVITTISANSEPNARAFKSALMSDQSCATSKWPIITWSGRFKAESRQNQRRPSTAASTSSI